MSIWCKSLNKTIYMVCFYVECFMSGFKVILSSTKIYHGIVWSGHACIIIDLLYKYNIAAGIDTSFTIRFRFPTLQFSSSFDSFGFYFKYNTCPLFSRKNKLHIRSFLVY